VKNNLDDIAVCGIYCGACPHKLGHINRAATALADLLEGWNFADVAPFLLPPGMKYPAFREVLTELASGEPCEGCRPDGNPLCPIKTCAERRQFATCSECGDFMGASESPGETREAGEIFRLISARYSGWNLENLKRIREAGLDKLREEMERKVREGFTTCEVISRERIFSR